MLAADERDADRVWQAAVMPKAGCGDPCHTLLFEAFMAEANVGLNQLRGAAMVRRRSKTAAEFATELANESEYQERLRTQQALSAARAAEIRMDEAELVRALRAAGEPIDTVWDYVSRGPFTVAVEPTATAISLLVEHLEVPHHARVREGVIRALSRSSAACAAREPILRAFQVTRQDEERWLLASALAAMVSFESVAHVPNMDQFRTLFSDRAP